MLRSFFHIPPKSNTIIRQPHMYYRQSSPYHFWMRAETKPHESRTILLPEHVVKLVGAGHRVTVEESAIRCVPILEYKKAGGDIVPEGKWVSAEDDAIILALKEVPDEFPAVLKHNHIFFGHCYKGQAGAEKLLKKFVLGKGVLWDLEFLVDKNKRRVAAFGEAAGKVGMALGLITWADIQLQRKHQPLQPFKSYDQLKDYVSSAIIGTTKVPSVLIIGALGRVGGGAASFANETFGIKPIKWDIQETNRTSGPIGDILEVDIFVNTIYLNPENPKKVFLTKEIIQGPRQLSVIVDISCDPNNKANPLPIYEGTTDFHNPAKRILEDPPLDIIAIDHLPSLVPEESSREFADALLPHLMEFGKSIVWQNAKLIFEQKSKTLQKP